MIIAIPDNHGLLDPLKYYDFIKKTNMSIEILQLWNRKDCHYKSKEEEFKNGNSNEIF